MGEGLERMQRSILDVSLGKRRPEASLSLFSLIFSEIVLYAQDRANDVVELEARLKRYGRSVGARVLEVIVYRENKCRRDVRLRQILLFLKTTVWRTLFGYEADRLEKSIHDKTIYLLMEREPLVNRFISVPRDKGALNCAAFTAGIVEAVLEASGFPCEVSTHWHHGMTAYLMKFADAVIERDEQLLEGSSFLTNFLDSIWG